MALPFVKTLSECANFTETVQPYLPQLNTLGQKVLQAYANPTEIRNIYIATNPFISGLALSLFLAPIFLVISEINKNYSQVDRCWSLLPTIYNAHFVTYAHLSGLPTQRLDNVIAFSVTWTLRLTFNYWRRGGYSIGSEDYRWQYVQDYLKPYPGVFFIFNVLFISLGQSVILYSLAWPTYVLLLASRFLPKITTTEMIIARGLIGLVLVEFFADNQQWYYQGAKSLYRKTAKIPPKSKYTRESLDRGFVTTGLWRYSRHPNFAAEQTIWATLYLWSCYTTEVLYNWTGVATLSLMFLFQASTWLTELITAGKYQDYPEYQRRVGKFLPKLWGQRLEGEFDGKPVKSIEGWEKGEKKVVKK